MWFFYFPPRDVAKSLGVSIPTLYRWVPAASSQPGKVEPVLWSAVSSEMKRLGKPATDQERERSRELLLTVAQLRGLPLRLGSEGPESAV